MRYQLLIISYEVFLTAEKEGVFAENAEEKLRPCVEL
jgi:hypothetical protein